ncbi:MAG: hypothetical protein ACI4HM_02430 [Ruminococcus sp.]
MSFVGMSINYFSERKIQDEHHVQGEWQELNMWRNHSNFGYCFNITVKKSENEQYIACGRFCDKEGNEYKFEDGIAISRNAVEELRKLNLEQLPNEEKSNKNEKCYALDGTEGKYTLTYSHNQTQSKVMGEELIDKIKNILANELLRKH